MLIDDPEALLDHRGGGVLVVDTDFDRAREWVEPLQALRVEVDIVGSLATASVLMTSEVPPKVILAREWVGNDLTEEWCQRVRSDVTLNQSAIVVLLDSGSPRGRWADDYINAPWTSDCVAYAVQAALREHAVRRNIARRERRRAIRWLSSVVSHELNNPLAAALGSLDEATELIESVAKEKKLEEALELLQEALASLERIKDAEQRFHDRRAPSSGDMERTEIREWCEDLERVVAGARVQVRPGSKSVAVFDRELIVNVAAKVIASARQHCSGAVTVTASFEGGRVALLIEFDDAPAMDPEAILTPRLVSDGTRPMAYDPGLSALESAFGDTGGQIFATPIGSGWRFGLTLPNHLVDDVAEEHVA